MLREGLRHGLFGYLSDYLLFWLLFVSLLVHTWCFFRFFPRKTHPRTGLVLGNGLIFLCMLGVIGMAAETWLRFAAVYTDSYGASLPARRWFALHTQLNEAGFRDDAWSPRPPAGTRRIAFVGDSFAYGWGIERVADRFPDLVQARFERRRPGGVEVMNVARPGWDTGAMLDTLPDLVSRYGIDEVVLTYVPNDIEGVLPRTGGFDPTRPPDWWLVNLDASPLLDYLYRRVYLPRTPGLRGYHDWLAEGFEHPPTWSAHTAQLSAIVRHCTETGVTLRVALLPFLRTGGNQYDARKIHDQLRHWFEQQGVPVVDLRPVIAGHDVSALVVNSVDPHPNEAAHALFAEAIWSAWYAADAGTAGNP